MKQLFLSFFLLMSVLVKAQDTMSETCHKLSSPDGSYLFNFYQDSTSHMHYRLTYKSRIVVEEGELGVQIKNQLFESALAIPNDTCQRWGDNLRLIGVKYRKQDEVWRPVYGERAEIRDCYNEMVLEFRKGNEEAKVEDNYDRRKNYLMNIVVRAYNEGVAFRYHFPEATNGLFLHIIGEETSFTMPKGTMAYFERWTQGPYEFRPLEGWGEEESERPLTMKLPDGLTVALHEAEMTDYARSKFRLSKDKSSTLETSLYSSVDIITPYNTPWRVIMVAERPVELINHNDLILNLNPSCHIVDVSWIKPGKVFRSGDLKQVRVKDAIDFAVERGMQYVHLDAGWYGPEMKMSSDATTVSVDKDLDMRALCKYAESKSIGLMVYVNQRALVQQLDSLLPLYKEWGIKAIKFGFVQIGNQHWTIWLHEAIRKCAKYGIMVDIHDEYRPTGFSRTYPNLMTQEGIRGNEEMPDATHNTILPYTRLLAGAGDYTLCYYNNRVKNTKAHQLAMAAVYYSPLQFMFWYDNPTMYQSEEELDFWKAIPTVWDESRALDGEIGEYIVQARRSGKEWFVGVMTNTASRNLTITTDFLKKDMEYMMRLYEDDDSLDTRTKVRSTCKRIKAGDKFTLKLKSSGGAAIHFVPVE